MVKTSETRLGVVKTFLSISQNSKISLKAVSIDNAVFKLHYLVSHKLLLICTAFVYGHQYLGGHINCIADKGVSSNVINTFCFSTSTFTLVNNADRTRLGATIHPGVGPVDLDTEEVIHHAYYQWVPFVLFAQAMLFYIPRLVWGHLEGRRVEYFVKGFELAPLELIDKEVRINRDVRIPSASDRSVRIVALRRAFVERLGYNEYWAASLVFCELLNAANVIFQGYAMQKFLGGSFLNLGLEVMYPDEDVDRLDVVFPKMTKCTFHKFGATGSIMNHDALCVMPLNAVNEKIYVFLWFWMVFVGVMTAGGLLWRVLTLCLHSRWEGFTAALLKMTNSGVLDHRSLQKVVKVMTFSDWMLLRYIAKNIHGIAFKEMFDGFCEELGFEEPDESPVTTLAVELNTTSASANYATEAGHFHNRLARLPMTWRLQFDPGRVY
uniref:Innexin n=1 Tax=Timema douglasi TaxID=61478 RepID=A0A7R8VFZ8_TIMDO|nr:unnamed protein product [Timema douglasi]